MATGTTGSVAWVVVVIDDIYNHMAAPQLDAIRAAALSVDQTLDSVFDDHMPAAAARVRQYIASNPRNRLSQTEDSVPPECKPMVIWFTLQDMFVRLSIAMLLTSDQKDSIRTCEDDLNKIRNITPPFLAVSTPDDPEENPAIVIGIAAEVVNSTTRQMTRCTLKGL